MRRRDSRDEDTLWRDTLKPEDTLIHAIINVCVLHVSGMCWMRGMWQDQYLFRHEWQIELGARDAYPSVLSYVYTPALYPMHSSDSRQ